MKKITVSKAIGEALHEEMLRDDKVFIMGEDMAVMGNVFAITKGFLEEFGPKRVIDTPISEEGFVGMAVGAAMRGMRPVVELMYDDFATECADPLFNQAAKIRYMTGGQCHVPMVLRAPMGAGRRNAGQHSQSLENFFCHFPGLKVVAPCTAQDAKGLLKSAIRDDDPVIFLEHKLLYAHKEQNPEEEYTSPSSPGAARSTSRSRLPRRWPSRESTQKCWICARWCRWIGTRLCSPSPRPTTPSSSPRRSSAAALPVSSPLRSRRSCSMSWMRPWSVCAA
mgnify:CR=1 FL=1